MYRWLSIILCAVGLASKTPGQVHLPPGTTTRSRSGQFVVYAPGSTSGRSSPNVPTNPTLVPLNATLVAVSCERIKEALLWELAATDRWRGKVHLVLRRSPTPPEPIVVTSSRYADGWTYHVTLPEWVEPPRFVRAMVSVLFLEWANRTAGERSAELPAWLSEGMAAHLMADPQFELLLLPPSNAVAGMLLRPTARDVARSNTLAQAHARLQGREPLSLEALSWPGTAGVAEEELEVFRASAQLFVHELLRLRQGRAGLQRFLAELPHHLNWQTAFYRAFAPEFQRPLDLERWWALQTAHFTGRDLARRWSAAESRIKLDELLTCAVQTRVTTNDPPQRLTLPLQAVIQHGSFREQQPLLQSKIHQLQLLLLQVAPEVAPLVDEYRQVLEGYLHKLRSAAGVSAKGHPARPAIRRLVAETVRRLDVLDARRASLGVAPALSAPAMQPPPRPQR